MSVFESLSETTTKATDKAHKYVETSRDYFKLKVFQQLAYTLTLLAKSAIIGGLLGFAFIFLAISGAFALAEKLDSTPLGFLIVGLVFLVLAIFVYIFKSKLNSKIITAVAEKFFDE